MAVWFPAQRKHPPSQTHLSFCTLTLSSIRGSVALILYLGCVLGLAAEERGLGREEGEVFALVIQAAVPAAHAVTAGHGGGQHCVDSHGEVQRRSPSNVCNTLTG